MSVCPICRKVLVHHPLVHLIDVHAPVPEGSRRRSGWKCRPLVGGDL